MSRTLGTLSILQVVCTEFGRTCFEPHVNCIQHANCSNIYGQSNRVRSKAMGRTKAKQQARAIQQSKGNSLGQVQMHESRAKGKDKGVAACQGNRAIVRTKATIRTKAKKNQAQAIA